MTADLNLDHLQKLAEEATQTAWRGVRLVRADGVPFASAQEIGEMVANAVSKSAIETGSLNFFAVVTEKPDGPADVCHVGNGPTSAANAAHIVAFSPRTALALLARLRAAEKEVVRLKDCDSLLERSKLLAENARLRDVAEKALTLSTAIVKFAFSDPDAIVEPHRQLDHALDTLAQHEATPPNTGEQKQ